MPTAKSKTPLSEATVEMGTRVRGRRKELGLSQEQLARVCDLHWSYVGQVERGRVNPTLHSILRLAAALDVTPGSLLDGLTAPARDATDE